MANQFFQITAPCQKVTTHQWLCLGLIFLVGVVLRFWGLDSVGYHGDEETMGHAVKGILESGAPVLPSGMYYVRALSHSYIMAASTFLFGFDEWALRFPSAVAGSLVPVAGFFAARRMVPANWALAVALVFAVFPYFIAASQTARMYIFLVLLVLVFAIAVFRWERTGKGKDLLISFAVFLCALSFHNLAIFATPLYVVPGLLTGSWSKFRIGVLACVAAALAYVLLDWWIASHYIELVTGKPNNEQESEQIIGQEIWLWAVTFSVGIIIWILRTIILDREREPLYLVGMILMSVSIIAAAVWLFHIALIVYFFGAVFYLRSEKRLAVPTVAAVVLVFFFILFVYLQNGFLNVEAFKDAVISVVGLPNPWPYLRFAAFFPFAIVIYASIIMAYALRFIKGGALPDHVLIFLVVVWAPILIIGMFKGHVPLRYLIGIVPFFVICFSAALYDFSSKFITQRLTGSSYSSLVMIVFVLSLINVFDLYRNVNVDYADFPILTEHRGADHKGAAEFIKAQSLDAKDLVFALDALQQYLYLGDELDYYLRSLNSGRNSTIQRSSKLYNLYTGTPQVTSGKQLDRIIESSNGSKIYIIGSGELEAVPELYYADGISEVLARKEFELVYEGRDGATHVWKYNRPTE